MKVNLLITEHQKKVILLESINRDFGDTIKKNYEFVKTILNKSADQIGFDLKFTITWGASIGGMVGPLNDFLNHIDPSLSDVEISLLLTGIIATYYLDNKTALNKIVSKIKENGLYDTFKSLVKKGDELKDTFLKFMGSLNLTLHKVSNMMSYTFIIPLIPMLYQMAQSGNYDNNDIKQVALRLASFGLLTVSSVMVRELISKLLRRFKG